MIFTAGPRFNRDEDRHAGPVHDFLLIAVNELRGDGARERLDKALDAGVKVLLDSGIFWLTNEHCRKTGMKMDQALKLPLTDIPDFDWLMGQYFEIVEKFGDRLWGYIELDQGGAEVKKVTRAGLEANGLKPIPVYHPLVDGWDYFDELAQNYDRICCGNIVQASVPVRKKLIATFWQRHRQYPHLWIHLLGYTPDQMLYSFPADSGDSSTWKAGQRFHMCRLDKAAGKVHNGFVFGRTLRYRSPNDPDSPPPDDESDSSKATLMAAYVSHFSQVNWRNALTRYTDLGTSVYPPTGGPL